MAYTTVFKHSRLVYFSQYLIICTLKPQLQRMAFVKKYKGNIKVDYTIYKLHIIIM